MDRQLVYPGSIPLDTDLLQLQRNAMVTLGMLARAVLGSDPVAEGLVCGPGPGLSVVVGAGSLSELVQVDRLAFGSLPADGHPLVKLGLNPADVVLPLTASPQGTTRVWLVQATVAEADSGPVALPYYNSGNPAVAWSGPANSGLAQNTQRLVRAALSVKAGGPATDGTQAAPDPDAGWVGLYGVTVRGGQSVVADTDIVRLPGAPFLSYRLPQLTPGFSREEVFGASGTWRVPAGVRLARVRLVGAGGGGGGGDNGFGGGGGGAGGFAEAVVPVEPGSRVPLLIGVGGAGAGPGINGGSGGDTKFAGGLVAASGGQGGGSNNPDSRGGAGGVGLQGVLLLRGGFGTDGPRIGQVPAGAGGMSILGGGGRGSFLGGVPANGQAPGSGAGGGYGPGASGGLGADGLVIVEY